MAFIGRFQLGDVLPLLLVTRDASLTPQVPTVPPAVTIWSSSAKVEKHEMPMIERFITDGMFLARVFLGSAYSTGLYTVSYNYAVGSYQGVETDSFEILPGGSVDGNVMSMYFYRRPQADFIVQGLDSGKIVQGRNPSI